MALLSEQHRGEQRNIQVRLQCENQERDCETGIRWTDDAVATVLGAFFWGIFVSEVFKKHFLRNSKHINLFVQMFGGFENVSLLRW